VIKGISALGGGEVTSDGGATVTDRGLCWNTTGNPTLSDSCVSDGTAGTGVFTNSKLTGLTQNTVYYVRAYATNNIGTGYGNQISFNSGYTFGTAYEGGLVFYNDGFGHGLVSATADISSSIDVWITGGTSQTTANNNTSTATGTGKANSDAIISQPGETGSAAQDCENYTDGTYHDWYLPSKDELNLMYTNLHLKGFGGFGASLYWSSSENDANYAWIQYFYTGYQYIYPKSVTYYVRAVRTF
jgi:hypothetical protein